MTLKVHHLRPAPGAHTPKTRVGRGEGSKGKTAGRGTKGTGARGNTSARFEGGQTPLHMRLPKLSGFKNNNKVVFQVVNLDRIAALFPQGGSIDPDSLAEAGAVRRGQPVKVLGTGDLGGVKVDVHGARVLRVRCREDRRGRGQHHPHLDETVDPLRARPCPAGVVSLPGPRTVAGGLIANLTRPTRGGHVLQAFAAAFRTPDLRRKLLFSLAMIAIYRLGASVPGPGVSVQAINSCLEQAQASEPARHLLAGEPVLRRRAAAAVGLRARDHAVHHGQHHRAAARGRDPAVRAAEEGRAVGAAEADPVHPLPDDRAWRSCRAPASSPWPAAASCSRAAPSRSSRRTPCGRRSSWSSPSPPAPR